MAQIYKSDFECAFTAIAKCVGTLSCGCNMSEEDEEWAAYLYREVHTFLNVIEIKTPHLTL